MNFSVHEQTCLALGYLLDTRNLKAAYWNHRDHFCLELSIHPFGFDTAAPVENKFQATNHTFLLASPGHTDSSVQAMQLVLQEQLRIYHPQNYSKFRLRIIYAQVAENKDNLRGGHDHDVYFEMITSVGTFLCGGCTDYSGQGRSGRRKLEAIFQLTAALYQIAVEEVVVPLGNYKTMASKLDQAYDRFMQEKRGSSAA